MTDTEPSRTSRSGREVAPIERRVTPTQLSRIERDRVAEAIAASRSPATRRAYASAWRAWETWCAGRDAIPIQAEPEVVAAYLTELADRGMSSSSVDKAVAAIGATHSDAGLADPTKHAGVLRVRAGIRRTIGTAPRRQAHPLSTDEIRRIVTTIDHDSLRGLRDRAIILVGYAGALRRSELAGLAVGDVTFRSAGVIVRIRRSKTDQDGAGQHVGITRGHHQETDPIAALHGWVNAAMFNAPDAPLFQSIAWSNRRATGNPLGGRDIARILVRRADDAGLGDLAISGHSLRAGHATTAAENGVPADRLARTTRHASLSALARYVRPAEALRDSSAADLGL